MNFPILFYILISLVFACNKHKDSLLKVTNGKIVSSNFTSVVQISNGSGKCTATFIRHNLLLTAAHCITSKNILFQSRIGWKRVQRIIINKSYDYNSVAKSNDLALLVTEDKEAPSVTPICNSGIPSDAKVSIVGFGNNVSNALDSKGRAVRQGSGSGVLRHGINTLISKVPDNGMISVRGMSFTDKADGSNSSAGSGDSGGPLIDRSENCIIGVTSAAAANETISLSSFVYVQNNEANGLDWPYYVVKYSDVEKKYGADPEKIRNHWKTVGKRIGRSPNAGFDPHWYLMQNKDLRDTVGPYFDKINKHWKEVGIDQCRSGSSVFNPIAIRSKGPDKLKKASCREIYRWFRQKASQIAVDS